MEINKERVTVTSCNIVKRIAVTDYCKENNHKVTEYCFRVEKQMTD
jgi:hypothetical protein